MAALQLYRRDARTPFSRPDIAFLRSLATSIGDALAAATAREQALLAGSEPGAAGVVFVRRSGELTFATPAGEHWLEQLRAAEPGNADELPTPVVAVVASLRASDGPNQQIVTRVPAGQLTVEASPAGQDDAVAVVMTIRQPPSEPMVPASWPLTPQERQVAGLLARGLTN
ncbi:MAG: hypothetical protein ACRD1H_18635, partial [Vicinamibacterales bacterium]